MKAKLSELLVKDKKRRAKEEKVDFPNYVTINSSFASPSSGFASPSSGHSHAISPWGPGAPLPLMITDSASFMTGSFISFNENLADYVFGEKEVLPVDVAMRRIEKYRKKHPEEFTKPLEKMYEKAYPKKNAGIFGLFKKEAK